MASMKEKYGHNFKTTSKKNEKDDKKTSSGKSMQEKYGHNFTGAQRESQKPSTVISSKNTQAASLRRGGASPDGVDTAEDIALRRNTSRATYEQELTAAKKKSSAASAILTDEALFDNSSMEENLRRLQESRQAKNNADNIEKKLDIMDLTEKWGNTAYREIEDADSFGDKWDNFWSQTGANIGAGRLSQETSRAFAEYAKNPTEENKQYALQLRNIRDTYVGRNANVMDDEGAILPWISQSGAQYLPQLGDQIKGVVGGGAIGGVIGAGIGSFAGPGGTAAGWKIGKHLGASVGSGASMYDVVKGAAVEGLVDEGVDIETASRMARDEGFLSAAIEAMETGGDIAVLSKLGWKGFALAYFLNIGSEMLQEGMQQGVSIATIDRAKRGEEISRNPILSTLDLAGDSMGTLLGAIWNPDSEEAQEIWEAAKEGGKISAIMGGATRMAGLAARYGVSKAVEAKDNQRMDNIGSEYQVAAEDLVNEGLSFEEGTEAHQTAQKLKAKLDAGETVSNKELAVLAAANDRAIGREASATVAENETVQPVNEALMRAAEEAVGIKKTDAVPFNVLNHNAQAATAAQSGVQSAVDRVAATQRKIEQKLSQPKYGRYGMDAFAELSESNTDNYDRMRTEFEAAYQAGLAELPRNAVTLINQTQEKAYQAGRQDYILSLEDNTRKGATVWGKKGGLVQNSESQKLDKQVQTQLDRFGRATGSKIIIDSRLVGTNQNGYYQNGEIHISPDANRPMMVVARHEVTHHLQLAAPEAYTAFRSYAIQKMNEGLPYGSETAAEEMRGRYLRSSDGDVDLTTEEAMDEVAAHFAEKLLSDEKAMDDFIRDVSKSKDTRTWAQKFFDSVRAFVEKVKKAFGKGKQADQAVLDEYGITVEQFEKAEKLWMDAVREAGRSETTSREAAELSEIKEGLGKGATVQKNANGEMLIAKSEDGSKIMYSYKTFENGGREKLRQALRQNGHTTKEINETIALIEDAADYLKILAAGYAQSHNYTALHDHLIADITTNIKTGKQVMSALVNNGDYPVNIDLALICKKRVAYMNLMTRLIEDGILDKVNYQGEAIADVNEILRANNFETACLGCFVESRRLQFQAWAETICSEWNDEVRKRRKNPKAFGFAEGYARLTDAEMDALQEELKSAGKKNKQGNLNLGTGSVKTKIGRLLDRVPSLQQTLDTGDLLTPKGLAALRAYDSNLFSIVKSRYGAASPKIVQDFNPYASEIAMMTFKSVSDITSNAVKGAQDYIRQAKKDTGGTPKKEKHETDAAYKKRKAEWNAKAENEAMRKYLYDIGGARMQSFSDFMIENVFDYLQIYADLTANKFPLHGYTKEIICLRLLGMTGAKWNGSLIAHTERSMGKEYAGLLPASAAKDGSAILVHTDEGDFAIGFDDYARNKATQGESFIQSIGMKDIVALQLDPRYSANVGSITIGVSDKQILAMLDNPLFSMVIPYHASGMLPGFAQRVGVDMYNDYTDYQNTSVRQMFDTEGNRVEKLTKANGDTIKIDTSYAFNAEVQKTGDARKAADNYIKWCGEKHPVYDGKKLVGYATFSPKFSDSPYGTDFSRHPNYYKLLEDFCSYDSVTGASAIQGAVTMTFPSEENRLTAKQMAEYKQRLRDTGLYSEKDIAKYEAIANKSFKELIADEVKGRAEYKVTQDAKWEKTVKEIEDKLSTDYAREGAKFSLKDKPVPTYAQLIAKPDMVVVDISRSLTNGSFAERRHQMRKNTGEVIKHPYVNKDTGTKIFLTKDSYTHTFNNSGVIQLNAAEHLPELVENAVLTHAEAPTHGDVHADGVYTFFAAAKNTNVVPVKLKVKEYPVKKQDIPANIRAYFESNPEEYASVYDSVVLEVLEIEESPLSSGKDVNHNGSFLAPKGLSTTIKVADLVALVNGEARKYLPAKTEKYSVKDSSGREMTSEQAEYFKDSVVRDDDGNLLRVYHGTNADFTVFDRSYLGKETDRNAAQEIFAATAHIGFWFNTQDMAKVKNTPYSKSVPVYLDIKKPYYTTLDGLAAEIEAQTDVDLYDDERHDPGEIAAGLVEWLEWNGYDGLVVADREFGGTSFVALNPEQIKSVDNKTPTSDPDIRYSLKDSSALNREIERIIAEGAKTNKSEEEIQTAIRSVVGRTYRNMVKEYGAIDRGEKPYREAKVPRKSGENERVSESVRTILEARVTPTTAMPTIKEMTAKGEFSYERLTNEQAMADADAVIRKKKFPTAYADWVSDVKSGKVNAANTALGWALYNNAVNSGDMDTAMNILVLMVGHQRNAAQALQASRILKKLTPEAQLYSAVKTVDDLQEEIDKKNKKKTTKRREAARAVDEARGEAAEETKKVGQDKKVRYKGGRVVVEGNQAGEPFVFEYAQKVGEAMADKLEKMATQTKKQKTFLQQITEELTRFGKEKMPKTPSGEKALTATDLLRDYIQNQAFYNEAWEHAQVELRQRHEGDARFIEFINSGIGVDAKHDVKNVIFTRALVKAAADTKETKSMIVKQGALGFAGMSETIADQLIRETGATGEMADTIHDAASAYVADVLRESDANTEKLIDASIREALKDIGETLTEIVKQGAVARTTAKQAIIQKLIGKYGFGMAEASHVADVVGERFELMAKQRAESILEARFKPLEYNRKSIPEMIEDYGKLGAFDIGSAYNERSATKIFKSDVILKINEDLAQRFLEAQTQEERDEILKDIYRDIGSQMPASWVDKWNAWRYMAMLTNPTTHVRNFFGNAFFAPVVVTKDMTATIIEGMVNFASKGKIGRTKAIPNAQLLKAAWDDYDNAVELIMSGGKYSDSDMKNRYIQEGRRIFKTKAMETIRIKNSEAMETEDSWFARPHYALALAQYCKANGVTADQLRRGKALGNAREYAVKEAQKATYRDTNEFSEFIGGLGRYHGDNKVAKAGSMVMEGILPFRKTPANILVRGLEYSPVGIGKALWQVARGEATAAEVIDSLAAGLTGTGLVILGAWFAAEGLIRGSGGDDDDEVAFEELQGHQAYSLELPNGTSATLDWLAPEVLPFFVGANLYEHMKESKEAVTMSDMITAIANVTEPMLEMSCLQSLNDVFDSVSYASSEGLDGLPSALASAVTSYLTQAFPTLLGKMERISEDERMTTYTEKNAFLTGDMQYTLGKVSGKVPGKDYNQIPYIDAWGRTESNGSMTERMVNNLLNPAYMSEIQTSAMEEELQRLHDLGLDGTVLPSRAKKYFNVGNERKDLTAEEYVKYASENGQRSYDLLTEITSLPEYEEASDDLKVDMVEMAYEYANAVAKMSVSDYEPTGWVASALNAQDNIGMSETEYILWKTALSMVDEPDKNGEYGGSPTTNEKAAAIDMMGNLSDKEIAYLWDTKSGYEAYDLGVDMKGYVEYLGKGGNVDTDTLGKVMDSGFDAETYYDYLEARKKFDEPNSKGNLGTYTNEEKEHAIRSLGLGRRKSSALWLALGENPKSNPFD